MRAYWLERALLDDRVAEGVLLVERGGLIAEIVEGVDPSRADARLPGVAMAGFANAHSHAFHRALRGRTHHDDGSFWTWRHHMYRVADALDPDSLRELATAVFAEMVLAGWTAVGEFHYLHAPGGMDEAVLDAAEAAGIRLTLLDTLYLRGGLDDEGRPVAADAVQSRFLDRSVAAWSDRHARLAARAGSGGTVRLGAAVHSLRGVPAPAAGELAAAVRALGAEAGAVPIHAHVSEQPRENAQVLAETGRTPVAALAEAGVLGPDFTAVHATHLTEGDIRLLAQSGSGVCLCPTTERDLADGVGPAAELAAAGVPLSLGSDQHAVIDPFAELQALELDARAASGRRGRFRPEELRRIASRGGARALGWDAGELRVGAACDLVSIDPATPRTAGASPAQLPLAASAADVREVVVAGRRVVVAGRHRAGDVGALLGEAVERLDARTRAREDRA
ncbi:formimidoylglutamate deiminase [Homoserinibacter sp. YIM 151385]|uniref:formimidoylglutamate deiminase n=1 Tax=Homoserinibacter sp. YIM 151385 TaxID=2985506 RepID=UPI0022F0EA00|nr:formimidoylglutamate deiminase [Homoserinibacter sp. YIM 151385]WBU37674.1 formimidoylglutamate deiminase [Homoserinibacter sp. YIM 151385]